MLVGGPLRNKVSTNQLSIVLRSFIKQWPCVLQFIVIAGLLSGVASAAFSLTSSFHSNLVKKKVFHPYDDIIVNTGHSFVILRIRL